MPGTGRGTGAGPDAGGAVNPLGSLRRLSQRTPLRVKLITALLALVALALAVFSLTSIAVFRGYLLSQTDAQLVNLNAKANASMSPGNGFGLRDLAFQPSGFLVEVLTPGGNQMTQIGNVQELQEPGPAIPVSAPWLNANAGRPVTVPAARGSGSWRVIVQKIPQPNGTYLLVVGHDLASLSRSIGFLTELDVVVSVIIVLGLGVVSVAVVRANLRPLDDIERTAEEIAAGHLNLRVPDRDPRTEVGRLGRSINIMLTHIESAFHAREKSEEAARASEERMRRFIADASHELRTPVTAIRGFAEYYRQRGGAAAGGGLGPADLDRIMHRVESEASRMGVLVEDLLLLARLDQQRPVERRPVDLLVLAADAVQDSRMIAPDRPVNLTVEPGHAFLVLGDEARLRQVIGNLMTNALTHTPAGTPVDVRLGSGTIATGPAPPDGAPPPAPAVVLEVADQGPGLTPEQAQRVFERFYRADQARNRRSGGSGLGLAIVSALVTAHGGRATVDSAPGHGATFRITLPLAPGAEGGDGDQDEDTPGSQAGVPGQPGTHPGLPAPPGAPPGRSGREH